MLFVYSINEHLSASDLLSDVVRLCRPDERLGILIVAVDVFSDGPDELLQIPEDAVPKLIAGKVTKEPLQQF